MTLGVGLLGALLAAPLLSEHFGQWRRPLVKWMVEEHLVGTWVWHVVHGIHLRDVLVGMLAGLLIGGCSLHFWRRFAVFFALIYLFARVVHWYVTGYLDFQLMIHGPVWLLNLPTQLVMLLGAALLGAWLGSRPRRRLRERRLAAGCCQACGYDLRGSPAERCPECGGKVAARRLS